MQCPRCGNYENIVIKTLLDIRANTRKRIRLCLHCGKQYRTIEKISEKKKIEKYPNNW